MKTRIVSIVPSGYGHKKVTIEFRDGKEYSAVTDNMPLVDEYNAETFGICQEKNQRRATRRLIDIVKQRNLLV